MVIYLIKDYEIRFENNQEILYLYIDFNSEFARLDSKSKKRKLKKYINDYIKRHKIDFRGTSVAIMVGGILVGTIILNKPINKNISNHVNKDYVVSIVSENDINFNDIVEDNQLVQSSNIKENIVDEENNEEIKKENKSSKLSNVKEVENQTNTIKDNSDIVSNKDTVKEETIDSSKIYVSVYRTSGEVLNIELEEYLVGVVAAEMPASFNIEALKAQSVLARTYTLKSIRNGRKLTDNSSTQNYKSNTELEGMWGNNYNTYYNKVKNAVLSTSGEYLSYNGDYIEAVYHSTSNGKTEDSKYVWGNSFPYLISVDSVYDSTNKNFLYEVSFTNEEVSKKLGQSVNEETVYNITSRNESGRVESIFIDNILYSGVDIRTKLGLRSTDFVIEKTDNGIKVTTKGYGHGVGMSQYGANGMANNGYDYKSILLHYYSGVSISHK